jgi:hypothetical protein
MTSRVIETFGKECVFSSSRSHEDNKAYRGQGVKDRATTRNLAIIFWRFRRPNRMWLCA